MMTARLWVCLALMGFGIAVGFVQPVKSGYAQDATTITILVPERAPLILRQANESWLKRVNIALRDSAIRFEADMTSRLAELLQDVMRENVQGAWVRLNDSPYRMQWTKLFSAPGRTGSSALLSSIMWRLHARVFQDTSEFYDLQVLGLVVLPPPLLRFTRSVQGLSDFRGQALRCQTDDCERYVHRLGINLIQSADENVATGLDQGRYVGLFFPPLDSGFPEPFLRQWKTKMPYVLSDPVSWPRDIYALVLSRGVWDTLPKRVQDHIRQHSEERFSERMGAMLDDESRRFLKRETPFLSEYKLEWPVRDLQILRQRARAERDDLIRQTTTDTGLVKAQRLRNIERILIDEGH